MPSWSLLYRRVIPPLVDDGCRVIAPDLIGFGRSDKPTRQQDHTCARHVAWVDEALFGHLDLTRVVLGCQDRGGLFGLALVASRPGRSSMPSGPSWMQPADLRITTTGP